MKLILNNFFISNFINNKLTKTIKTNFKVLRRVPKTGIIIHENTKVLVQGITGRQGRFHTKLMLEYGTKVVAGVTPGKGGETVHGVKVYDTVKEAMMESNNVNTSIVFVPSPYCLEAVKEVLIEGIKLVVVITEHLPLWDALNMVNIAGEKGARIIGANTPGIINPKAKCKVGIMPNKINIQGNIGVVSRSGTLSYEIIFSLLEEGLGISTFIGIGGDKIHGTNFTEALSLFEKDKDTEKIVMIGEVGGEEEEKAADYIKGNISKPVVAYIAGKYVPKGVKMGHAGAIIEGEKGTAENKIKQLTKAGVKIAKTPKETAKLLQKTK